ncbi:MAG: choice-of-anchor B family protein, partial [Flavobacteriales bacterium]|nr:choice-of-anchor B family protein [Flavobacteriales bacterium]
MRYLLIVALSLIAFGTEAQTSLNMNLVYQWQDQSLVPSSAHFNTYNEVWGYAKDGREYAIIGSTAGTHIFDITDINNVDTVDFIPGKAQGSDIIHRDYDTYQDYLYIVSDEGASSLQIADLTFLPDSAPVVYDDDALIIRSHNIFIDTVSGNLYTCGGATNMGFNKLSVYSLSADPTDPQFLINCENDVPFWSSTIGYVHDIYVKNDTAYCNAGTGLFIVDFTNMLNIQGLGSITSYLQQGYNHSGWLHPSGDYYALADETHGMDVKILDVTNFSNITFIDTIGSNVDEALSIPHNLIFRGDNLYVSYYFDGLYVFNTSDPNNISLAGYYDTSTRPHLNNKYEGNWGIYPFLPSGKILASDLQEGLFVFDVTFPTNL